MPNTPDNPTLSARIREILRGRSKWAVAGGGALLAAVVVAGALSRRTSPVPHAPPVTAHAATAAPRAVRPVVATTRPVAPTPPRHVAPDVAVAGAPPAPPVAAPTTTVALPAKSSPAATVAVAQPAARPTGLVSAAMPKPPKLVAGHALETMYELSGAGAWVQTSSTAVALPRSSFVVRFSSQATRATWAAWFKISAPTTVLSLTLNKGTDGDITVAIDGFRAFHSKRGAFSLTPRATLVSPLSLGPGWHELVVDYSRKWGWQHSAQITLAAGNGIAAPSLLELSAAPAAAAPTSAPSTAGARP